PRPRDPHRRLRRGPAAGDRRARRRRGGGRRDAAPPDPRRRVPDLDLRSAHQGVRMTSLPLAPAPRTRPRPLTAERVFVRRSLLHSLRDGESLLMAVLLPVLLMLMFTWVFGGAIDPSGGYVDYVVPGIILICAGFGASSTGVYVAG